MRGQLNTTPVLVHAVRIIPARAGPTTEFSPVGVNYQDHPRSCGANVDVDSLYHRLDGSSPLVRGQQFQPVQVNLIGRIIPARAGPTLA